MSDKVKGIALFGIGGHAKVIYEILSLNKLEKKLVLLVNQDNISLDKSSVFYGIKSIKESELSNNSKEEFSISHFIIGFAGASALKTRMKCFELAKSLSLIPLSISHTSSSISKSSNLGEGVQLMGLSFVNVNSKIGDNSIINSGAIIEHDCVIGKGCHIAPGAVLGGSVSVGDETFIGLGAKILQGVSIGSNVVIGAGSVVTKDIENGKTAYGVPAVEK